MPFWNLPSSGGSVLDEGFQPADAKGKARRDIVPTLGDIAHTLFASLADGTMLLHAAATLYRALIGFAFAVAMACPWAC